MLGKGMFINCWRCHFTTVQGESKDWYQLNVSYKDALLCTADFCTKEHLDYWLVEDLVPLFLRYELEEPKEPPGRYSGGMGSGSVFSGAFFGSQTGWGPRLMRQAKKDKCKSCGKKAELLIDLEILHDGDRREFGFCGPACLPTKVGSLR